MSHQTGAPSGQGLRVDVSWKGSGGRWLHKQAFAGSALEQTHGPHGRSSRSLAPHPARFPTGNTGKPALCLGSVRGRAVRADGQCAPTGSASRRAVRADGQCAPTGSVSRRAVCADGQCAQMGSETDIPSRPTVNDVAGPPPTSPRAGRSASHGSTLPTAAFPTGRPVSFSF